MTHEDPKESSGPKRVSNNGRVRKPTSELGPEEYIYSVELKMNNELAFWMVLSDEPLTRLSTGDDC